MLTMLLRQVVGIIARVILPKLSRSIGGEPHPGNSHNSLALEFPGTLGQRGYNADSNLILKLYDLMTSQVGSRLLELL